MNSSARDVCFMPSPFVSPSLHTFDAAAPGECFTRTEKGGDPGMSEATLGGYSADMNAFAMHSAEVTTAASVWTQGLGQFLAGLAVVGVLIGAFVLGRRIRDREPRPPTPDEQPHRPDTDRLPGEMSEYRRPAEMPQTDGEHRLMPYQLKDSGTSGTETSPEPPSEEKRKWGGISSGGFGSGGPGHGD
ncbi:DUF6479 family protein [Streptomyces sp. NPDC093600]|uniref:DUF6479 family protein n=1 Tax=Streptomyces sp. NPDC093600 TaxID=3366047 RepID=UPI003809F085